VSSVLNNQTLVTVASMSFNMPKASSWYFSSDIAVFAIIMAKIE